MTRARTKGQKLAEKRRRQLAVAGKTGALDLPPMPKREKNGRISRQGKPRSQDESVLALETRCRHMGRGTTEADMREAKAQWNGCNAGRAMAAQVRGERDRAELWDAIQHMRRVYLAYDRAMGAPRRYAQSLRLLLPLEAMEADASSPTLDVRTDEERQRQAVNERASLKSWLSNVEPRAAMICLSAVIDDNPCLDAAAMVRALHCVADGMAGRKMVYRGY